MSATSLVRLGDVTAINPRLTIRPPEDAIVSFVPMADLSIADAKTTPGLDRVFSDVKKGYTLFERGDILVAKITPSFENGKAGQAAISREIGAGSTEFHVFRARPDLLHNRYLLHLLRQQRVRKAGEKRMTGSAGQRRVPEAFFADLQIPLPPLDEQWRIVAILDEVDKLHARRCESLATLDVLAAALFADMFGSRSDIERVPLGAVLSGLEGGRNLVADDPEAASPFRVLKISAVTTGVFDPQESKPLPGDYVPPESHLVRVGDLLMSRANTSELVGATAYVWEAPGRLVLPDKIWRFVWKAGVSVEPLYVLGYLRTPEARRALSRLSSGTSGSMKNVSKSKLVTLPIPLPEAEEQILYAHAIREFQAHYRSLRRFDERLTSVRASLEHQAFTAGSS